MGTQAQQIVPLRQADQSKREQMILVICEGIKILVCEMASVRGNKTHHCCLTSCLPQGIQLSDFQHLADAQIHNELQ